MDLIFDFSIDKETKTISIKRAFAAERALVWGAFTQSRILDKWWAPKPWKAKTKTMDFREGGHWLYVMVSPEGEEHWARMDYKTIQIQEQFTISDAFTDAAGKVNKDLPESKWELRFRHKDKYDTLVEFEIFYDDFAQLEATIQMGFKEGLASAMEGLDELFAQLRNGLV